MDQTHGEKPRSKLQKIFREFLFIQKAVYIKHIKEKVPYT